MPQIADEVYGDDSYENVNEEGVLYYFENYGDEESLVE